MVNSLLVSGSRDVPGIYLFRPLPALNLFLLMGKLRCFPYESQQFEQGLERFEKHLIWSLKDQFTWEKSCESRRISKQSSHMNGMIATYAYAWLKHSFVKTMTCKDVFFMFFTNHSTPWHFACRKVVPEHWFCHHEQDGAGGSAAGKKKKHPGIPYHLWDWYMYPHLPSKSTIHVGKYISPMDPSWGSDPPRLGSGLATIETHRQLFVKWH